jgi:hypothetical protein
MSKAIPSSIGGQDPEAEVWNLLDALDWRRKPSTSAKPISDGLEISITDAIGSTSPLWIQGSSYKTWQEGERPPWEDLEIPNFPDLTVSGDKPPRTSGTFSQCHGLTV